MPLTSQISTDPFPPLQERTVGDVLRRAADQGPDDIVQRILTDTGELTWTAGQLLREATQLAVALLKDHRPGDRIATCLDNGPEPIVLQVGIALAGMTLVPLNPRFRPPEVEHALALSGASALFSTASKDPSAPVNVAGAMGSQNLKAIHACTGDWRSLLADAADDPGDDAGSGVPTVDPQSLAQIQFTSGTTGKAKGVRITHHGMVVTSLAFRNRLGITGNGGTWLNPMPLFHTAGNVLGVLGALWQRAEHIVMPFEPGAVPQAVGRHHPTMLSAAPTILDILMSHPALPETDTSSLEVVFTGGQRVSPSFVQRVEKSFGAKLSITFGMTETCGSAVMTSPNDPEDIRQGTVGFPIEGTEVCVVDPSGAAVSRGEPGEFWVRGERITSGYYEDPAATASAIDDDRWLHTGDLAVMTDSGACRIVGRVKDMLKTGGENVSPEEVEEVLVAHPSVARAAVVGVPDERWGEVVVAFIVPAAADMDTEQLASHAKSHLTSFKVPRIWHVVADLPMTASTKIQRAELRRIAAEDAQQSS